MSVFVLSSSAADFPDFGYFLDFAGKTANLLKNGETDERKRQTERRAQGSAYSTEMSSRSITVHGNHRHQRVVRSSSSSSSSSASSSSASSAFARVRQKKTSGINKNETGINWRGNSQKRSASSFVDFAKSSESSGASLVQAVNEDENDRSSNDKEVELISTSSSSTEMSIERNEIETEAVRLFKQRPGRHAMFSATKTGTIDVLENEEDPERSLQKYMSLPATSYSTLDGETVKRIDDYTFECTLGTLAFFGFKITPTVIAKVDVRANGYGPMISVEEATISGSKIVEEANEQFQLSSVNDVSWFSSPTDEHKNQKTIKSETIVSVYLIVPAWFPFTVKSTERTGRFVVNQVVGQVVPRFLKQLKADYEVWSLGDDSRKAVCDGGLFDYYEHKNKDDEFCDVSDDEIAK